MPNQIARPRTLKAWLELLDKQPLPVQIESRQKVLAALTDSRRSLREIAELIQSSPALAISVLREANASENSLGEPAESLENALNRLGLQRTQTLLERLPALSSEEIPLALRQIQLISQHASQQANGLFSSRLARLWQEIHWGSLLFLAPAWALVSAYPDLLDTWEQRVLVKAEPAQKVEIDMLGVPLLQLCLALAERWKLPEWICYSYRLLLNDRRFLAKALLIARDNEHPLHQQQCLDADPDLQRWLGQPANCILLANGLALSAHHAWDGPHSLRWQQLTGLYLQVPVADLQQWVHQQAAISARKLVTNGLWHPAQAMLWPWHVSHLQPAKPPPAGIIDKDDWRQLCQQLLSEPSAFNNVLQLTSCASRALHACGMQRVLLLLADRTQSKLVAQHPIGLNQAANGLSLDPQHSQVIRTLLSKPGQLRLTPENMAQFSARLPGALKELFTGEHWLLRSLGANGRVVMIAITDCGGAAFDESRLQLFAKTSQCIERAISNFANRGR
ncbi:HDOD domain-containing protein [Pseudomonas segetis]|uniref:HD-like signal output (HDOD) domain, no enzymatic activity n=1 Tax=Pseudomonas segetis TaxID=298908 RepID=A0A239DK68_9PSED|nr:HDOD domain-containing protein [Pseudomonas segetis]SNS32421.1 HD-like signal output (HDOD) domain, no enzymatic activity [Pseudomonas segetis]